MLTFLTTTLGKIAILATISLIALAVISRHWNCDPVKPPRPARFTTEAFVVSAVINGTTIEAKSGICGKQTRLIHLADIASPIDGPLAEKSRLNLELSCGKSGTVRYEHKRFFQSVGPCDACKGLGTIDGNECWACGGDKTLVTEEYNPGVAGESAEGVYESRGDLTGDVTGASGINLQIDQLEQGLARCNPDASSEYLQVEIKAKKLKIGMWK